jgi:hypothetical protein
LSRDQFSILNMEFNRETYNKQISFWQDRFAMSANHPGAADNR